MDTTEYQVPEETLVNLDKWPTKGKPICESGKACRKLIIERHIHDQ